MKDYSQMSDDVLVLNVKELLHCDEDYSMRFFIVLYLRERESILYITTNNLTQHIFTFPDQREMFEKDIRHELKMIGNTNG